MSTDAASSAKVFRLQVEPNNYPWGPVGHDSFSARLTPNASAPGSKIDDSKEYAELWMGTHPTNPAKLYDSDILLSAYLQERQDLLGDAKKFTPPYKGEEGNKGHVPFLFKILCCKQALPLQIHPNKKLAEQLNKENPEQFADTNHKPEIAVCLSDRFLGFASFRPLKEIKALLGSCPEVKSLPSDVRAAIDSLIRTNDENESKEQLRETWHAFLGMKGSEVESAVKTFCKRVKQEGKAAFDELPVELFSATRKQNMVDAVHILEEYNEGDGSIFAALFFMNLVELKKGEGMYVGADGIHAWLKGDIVELMAASDNVLNVGFTPEKDSTSLVAKTINVDPRPAESILLSSKPFTKGTKGRTTVYATPFEEFAILRIEGDELIRPLSGPGILIVTSQEEMHIHEKGSSQPVEGGGMGSVYFVGAGAEVEVKGKGEAWMAFYDGEKESAGQVGAQ